MTPAKIGLHLVSCVSGLIYMKKFQRIDWLRACQSIPNRVQKSEISAIR